MRDVNIVVPGKTKIFKRIAAIIAVVYGENQPSEIVENGIVYNVRYFCVGGILFGHRQSFPQIRKRVVSIFVCRHTVVGIAVFNAENKVPA